MDDDRRFFRAWAQLSEGQRRAMLLRYREGCSTVEVAAALGYSEENTTAFLRDARQRLSQLLDEQEE